MASGNHIKTLISTLQQRGLTLALAESMTCGLAAHQLATCRGTSEVFTGAVVCYTPEVKKALLKVPASTMARFSCESAQVTRQLARGLRALIQADVYAAVTGLAAPGGSESPGKPVGTVFFAVCMGNTTFTYRYRFLGSPLQVRKKACYALYRLITKAVKSRSRQRPGSNTSKRRS